MNGMDFSRKDTSPLTFPRTRRNRVLQNRTSFPAGKMVPLAYIPLLREDSVRRGRARVRIEMAETAKILMNPVRVDVRAYLVSNLCDPRFEKSMDQLNRSYKGQPQVEGGDVVPFIETHARGSASSKPFYKTLGLHAQPTTQVNTWPLKCYNLIWNLRAANRSADLTPRDLLDATLAPAFWQHPRFAHIKPTFDAAVAEGEVALNVIAGALPVTGLGFHSSGSGFAGPLTVKETGPDGFGVSVAYDAFRRAYDADALYVKANGAAASAAPQIFAEMVENGITVSLANIDLARKTQAFAKLREQFDGHDDDWIIDMLMSGLAIPDLAMTQPVLISHQSTVVGQSLRFATNSGNLDETATNGATFVDLPIRLPRNMVVHAGAVIMIVAEALPEQLWERQQDPYFHATSVEDFPDALVDTLDPQKVQEVFNVEIDTAHGDPTTVFGYGPLNWQWDMRVPSIGGDAYQAAPDETFNEGRQDLWVQEEVDPTLSQSHYICLDIHQNVFLNGGTAGARTDVFKAVTLGNVEITGLTQFGAPVIEANGNYEAVADKAPIERIEQE